MHQAHFLSLFITAENATFTFHAVLFPSKHQSYLSFYFEISKYVKRYLLCCLFAFKYVIFAVFFAFKLVITSVPVIFLPFNLKKNYPFFGFGVLATNVDLFPVLILRFLDTKYIQCI